MMGRGSTDSHTNTGQMCKTHALLRQGRPGSGDLGSRLEGLATVALGTTWNSKRKHNCSCSRGAANGGHYGASERQG